MQQHLNTKQKKKGKIDAFSSSNSEIQVMCGYRSYAYFPIVKNSPGHLTFKLRDIKVG